MIMARFFQGIILFLICAVFSCCFAEPVFNIELSKGSYSNDEKLIAIFTAETEDFGNETSLILTYSVFEKGKDTPVFEKTRTVSFKGERTVTLETDISDYSAGKYVFRVETEGMGLSKTLEKDFIIESKEGGSLPYILAVGVISLLIVFVFIRRRN